MPSLLDPLRRWPVAIVDVETTGASPRFGDRVTEIGVVRYEDGRPTATLQHLVDPQRRIAPGVVALTGITQEMVDGQPTFADRLDNILPVLRDAVVVGHNVRFDLGFLAAEFRRAGTTLTNELGRPHVLDTVRLARRRLGRGGNGLQKLAARFDVAEPVAHRALADALTTGRVLGKLLDPAGFDTPLLDVLSLQGGPMPLEVPPKPDADELPAELLDALEWRGRVTLHYLDANRRPTTRTVEPIEVRHARGTATLVAWCCLRRDRRTFKLDRIVRLERCGDS